MFAAGAFYLTRFASSDRTMSLILENLWARLSTD